MEKILPEDLTIEQFAPGCASDTITKSDARLRLCEKCPPYGGACDSRYEERRGETIYWTGEILDYRDCGRWPSYLLREKLRESGVPAIMLDKSLLDYVPQTDNQTKAKRMALAYIERFDRTKGLALVGPPGTGKTHVACSLLRALVEQRRVRTVAFFDVARLLREIREAMSAGASAEQSAVRQRARRLVDAAINADLIVLDDLGAQRTTDWVREELGIILNERWSNQRPVIVTSNQNLDYFGDTLGPRALSRLNAKAMQIFFDGTDSR